MDALIIIDSLSKTSSRIDKEQILIDAFMKGNRTFFVGARLALDPLITFGVKKVALIEEDDGEAGTFTFNQFLALVDKLRKRELTGNAARDAINDAALNCDVKTWNQFYRRILLKDLKLGVEEKTINKILEKLSGAHHEAKDFMIPVFSCQLAHDGARPEHAKKIAGERLLDVKLDGVRLLSVLDKEMGTVTQYTRNGKINENFTEITDALKSLLAELPGSVVFDGEIISTSFQELLTQINRKTDVKTGGTKLALFDIIPLADFMAGECKTPQSTRHETLSQFDTSGLLRKHTNGLVYVIPKVSVDLTTEEGKDRFAEFNRAAVDAGYEGIMVKNPKAPYQCKRTDAWLKIKPFFSVDLEIIKVEEGDADGKYVGQLGAIVCRGEDRGLTIQVNVGSGFTDQDRKTLWSRREEIIGMIVEIRADAVTKEHGSDTCSLRFPRFMRFRGNEKGEKL
jgi:DNA ligase-1